MLELYDKLYGNLTDAVVVTKHDKLIYFNKSAEDMGITYESRLCDITPIENNPQSAAESTDDIPDDDVHVMFLTSQTERRPTLPPQAVDSMLSSIRSQMLVLKMAMDLLLPVNWSEHANTDSKQNQKYYSMIYHSYYSLHRVLDNITDVYIEFGDQFKKEYTSFDVVQSLYELCNTVTVLMGAAGPTLDFYSDCGWLDIQANRPRLEQAVMQLLSNAIKYTPDDGKVILQLHKKNGYFSISVTDTGPGPKNYSSDLWKTYAKGRDMSDERAGAGFGLALVQKIAVAHGGAAFMEPATKDKGFSVIISMPIIEGDPEICDREFTAEPGEMQRILQIMADVMPRTRYTGEFLEW